MAAQIAFKLSQTLWFLLQTMSTDLNRFWSAFWCLWVKLKLPDTDLAVNHKDHSWNSHRWLSAFRQKVCGHCGSNSNEYHHSCCVYNDQILLRATEPDRKTHPSHFDINLDVGCCTARSLNSRNDSSRFKCGLSVVSISSSSPHGVFCVLQLCCHCLLLVQQYRM